MRELLAEFWWVLVLRGVAAIVFGVLAFLWPGLTIEVLIAFFGAYVLVDGVFGTIAALSGRRHAAHWVLMLLEGLLGIAVGIMTFVAPVVTGLVLLIWIGMWAILTGVIEVVQAIRLRKEIQGEFWLALAGLLSIGFGVLLLAFPLAGALAVLWVLASYAVAFGLVLVILGFRVRGTGATADRSSPAHA